MSCNGVDCWNYLAGALRETIESISVERRVGKLCYNLNHTPILLSLVLKASPNTTVETTLLRRGRTASPSNATRFQVLLNVAVKGPRHRNCIYSREVLIHSNPFGRPAFSRIHNGSLSLEEGRCAYIGSFRIVGLQKLMGIDIHFVSSQTIARALHVFPNGYKTLPYLEMDNFRTPH
jgi:hypothetical protein